MDQVLFYLFAAVAVGASIGVVTHRNPMYSVLLLIVSFIALAALYVQLDSPFAAVIQIIIYAGAIMVLFLFVVMLLNVAQEDRVAERLHLAPASAWARRMGAILAVVLAVELVWALARAGAPPDAFPGDVSSVRQIGRVLFTDYALAFEVTAVLTLVAMLGAIVLTRRDRSET